MKQHDTEQVKANVFLTVWSITLVFAIAAVLVPSPAQAHESVTHLDPLVEAGCLKLEDKIEDTIYLHLNEAATHARDRYLDSFDKQHKKLVKMYNEYCLSDKVFEDAEAL